MVLVSLVVLLVAAAGCQPSWTQRRHDVSSSGMAAGSGISPAAVGDLTEAWQASLGDGSSVAEQVVPGPLVADGTAVTAIGDEALAFDLDACAATPTCEPAWQADLPSPGEGGGVLVGSTALLGYGGFGPGPHGLAAYDLAGVDGCDDGVPRTCQPLWTLPDVAPLTAVVDGNALYVLQSLPAAAGQPSAWQLAAYDLATCPDACAPVWISTSVSAISKMVVAEGRLVVPGADGILFTLDASGVEGCTPGAPGAPAVCEPLTVHRLGDGFLNISPLAGGAAAAGPYAVAQVEAWGDFELDVVDPAESGCTPSAPCDPVASAAVPQAFYGAVAVAGMTAHAAGHFRGHAQDSSGWPPVEVVAVDVAACASGATCEPTTYWRGPDAYDYDPGVTIAGDVLWTSSLDGIVAFDRTPPGCGGETDPCPPLWVADAPAFRWSEVVVVGTRVLAVSIDGTYDDHGPATLHVWQLPA